MKLLKVQYLNSLILFLISFSIYANSISNDLVWDDNVIILQNISYKKTFSDFFFQIDSSSEFEWTPYYRPLTYLSFAVERNIHNFNPYLMHLFNVILHGLNSILFYFLIKTVTCDKTISLVSALFFTVHPISAEAVNFLSGGRNTLLSAFFVLLTCLVHIKSAKKESIGLSVVAALFFFLGALSKETALMFLPLVICYEIIAKRPGRFVRIQPYIVFTIAYLILRYMAFKSLLVRIDWDLSLLKQFFNNIYIIPRYLLTILLPNLSSINYPLPQDLNIYLLPLLVAWIFILLTLFAIVKSKNLLLIGALVWIVFFYIPTSGIFPLPSMPMADRYVYISMMGVWLCLGYGVRVINDKINKPNFLRVPVALLLIALSVITVRNNPYWHDDFTLFSRYIEQYPEEAFGHYNLGVTYLEKAKNVEAAEREFNIVLQLNSTMPRLMTQLGHIAMIKKDFLSALSYYDKALLQMPYDDEALVNKAIVLDRLGMYEEALKGYKMILAFPLRSMPQSERPKILNRVAELEEMLAKKN